MANQLELIHSISEKIGIREYITQRIVAILLDAITRNLAHGEEVLLPGFGKFSVKSKKVKSKDGVESPDKLTVEFIPGATLLKALINTKDD